MLVLDGREDLKPVIQNTHLRNWKNNSKLNSKTVRRKKNRNQLNRKWTKIRENQKTESERTER